MQRRRDVWPKSGGMLNESAVRADHFPVLREGLQQEATGNVAVRGSALPKKPFCALAHWLDGTLLPHVAQPVRRNLLRQQRCQRAAQHHSARYAAQAAAMFPACFSKI
jgi:hypothetical protein